MTRELPYGYGSVIDLPADDGTGKMQARWMERGTRRSRIFRAFTPDAARDLAIDHLLKMHRAHRDRAEGTPFRMTVADLIDGYLVRSGRRLTGRTIRTYRDRAATMILPDLGERRAQEVDTLQVQQWVDRLVADVTRAPGAPPRPTYAPSSIRAAISVLQAAYRDATTLGLVPRNVVTGVGRPSLGHVEARYWTAAEVARVLPVVREDAIYGALYVVALATGMRPGELRALQWANVDLTKAEIRVRASIVRDGDDGAEHIARRTKRGMGRTVAISFAVVQALRRHKARQNERRLQATVWHDLDIVFDRGDGHWLYQSGWHRYHQDLCTRAGVPYIPHHGLRHTAATLMLEQAISLKVIADILGHANIQTTLNIYAHVSDDFQRTAIEKLSSALFGVSNVSPHLASGDLADVVAIDPEHVREHP